MESNDMKQGFQSNNFQHKDMLSKERFGKFFLLGIFVLSFLAFLYVIKIFIIDIILAIALATLFYPFFKKVLKFLRNKRGISAFVTCITMLLVLLIPLIFIAKIVLVQAVVLFHSAGPQLSRFVEKDMDFIIRLKASSIGDLMSGFDFDWQEAINTILGFTGKTMASFINTTSKKTLVVIFDLFATLFATFYFLKDGERILSKIKESIPLNENYKNTIISKFSSILNATVLGVLYIALIQSFLGTITLWAFGVKSWLLWGGVMFVLATIPFVGTGFVIVPIGIFKILNGHVYAGITMILISVVLISTIDNFIRPRIVGHYAGTHDLLIFFGILGGISVFGPVGIIIGPIILSIFITVLEIYNIEFYEHIKYSKTKGTESKIEIKPNDK